MDSRIGVKLCKVQVVAEGPSDPRQGEDPGAFARSPGRATVATVACCGGATVATPRSRTRFWPVRGLERGWFPSLSVGAVPGAGPSVRGGNSIQ